MNRQDVSLRSVKMHTKASIRDVALIERGENGMDRVPLNPTSHEPGIHLFIEKRKKFGHKISKNKR